MCRFLPIYTAQWLYTPRLNSNRSPATAFSITVRVLSGIFFDDITFPGMKLGVTTAFEIPSVCLSLDGSFNV